MFILVRLYLGWDKWIFDENELAVLYVFNEFFIEVGRVKVVLVIFLYFERLRCFKLG